MVGKAFPVSVFAEQRHVSLLAAILWQIVAYWCPILYSRVVQKKLFFLNLTHHPRKLLGR